MRIFLDANILFSAALRGSQIQRLLAQLMRGHDVLTSDYAYEEALRNIKLKRVAWLPDFLSLTSKIEIMQSVDSNLPFPIALKDRPVLYTALKSKCDVLLTGDKKDFEHLMNKSIGPLWITSPLRISQYIEKQPPPSS